ncbi:hypothetical protein M0R45_030130 [Rubus argutus]|uniref:Uncharacterized protein n=1 Tax=Rubus argutus TaxID=59490 RepID=A0AAW1WCN0_RUBAR
MVTTPERRRLGGERRDATSLRVWGIAKGLHGFVVMEDGKSEIEEARGLGWDYSEVKIGMGWLGLFCGLKPWWTGGE